jgi:hypothetical protein
VGSLASSSGLLGRSASGVAPSRGLAETSGDGRGATSAGLAEATPEGTGRGATSAGLAEATPEGAGRGSPLGGLVKTAGTGGLGATSAGPTEAETTEGAGRATSAGLTEAEATEGAGRGATSAGLTEPIEEGDGGVNSPRLTGVAEGGVSAWTTAADVNTMAAAANAMAESFWKITNRPARRA